MKRILLAALCMAPMAALAQTSPNVTQGQVWTTTQWNAFLASKADTANPVFSGTINGVNAALSGSLNVTGNAALSGSLNVTGNAALSGSLNVTGAATLNGGGTLTGTFGGNPTFSGFLNYSGHAQYTLSPVVSNTNFLGVTSGVSGGLYGPTMSGTNSTGNPTVGWYLSYVDYVDEPTAAPVEGMDVRLYTGTSSAIGPRNAGAFRFTLQSASGNTGTGVDYTGLYGSCTLATNDNGTSLTPASACFGANTVSAITATSGYFQQIVGYEPDLSIASGATVLDKLGMQVVSISGDSGVGTRDSQAYDVNDQPSPAAGFAVMYGVNRRGGSWPCASAGCSLFAAEGSENSVLSSANAWWRGYLANYGFDTHLVNYNNGGGTAGDGLGLAWWSPAATLNGIGTLQLGGATLTPSQNAFTIAVNLVSDGAIGSTLVPTSGGAGCVLNDVLNGPNGGLFRISGVSNGVATQLTVVTPDWYASGSQPVSPITLGKDSAGNNISRCSPQVTISPTWTQANQIVLGAGTETLKAGGSGQWSANGSVATSLTSVGPSGAHTTVQEWFTIVDSAGIVRYIPAF